LFFFYAVHAIRIAPHDYSTIDLAREQSSVTESMDSIMAYTGRQRTIWQLAAQEEGLLETIPEPELVWGPVPAILQGKVSLYGFNTCKYPRSWVKTILAMNHEKNFKYMFSGSFVHLDKFRKWLPDFVKTRFGPEDYFRATDATPKWQSMGAFDRSNASASGYRPKSSCKGCQKFDESYWVNMVQSKFIMAPGGDAPYSFRFYESALAGSIPIIHDVKTDWSPTGFIGDNLKNIGYQYLMTTDAHEFDQRVADLNLKKFLRYQTFIYGDNDPEEDKKNGKYPTL